MQEAEIKLLSLKVQVLSDLNSNTDLLKFHATSEAKQMRELLQSRTPHESGILLTEDVYERLLDYLRCMERETLNQLPGKEYLKQYYTKIEFNKEILKNL